jgi:hypothetical protein
VETLRQQLRNDVCPFNAVSTLYDMDQAHDILRRAQEPAPRPPPPQPEAIRSLGRHERRHRIPYTRARVSTVDSCMLIRREGRGRKNIAHLTFWMQRRCIWFPKLFARTPGAGMFSDKEGRAKVMKTHSETHVTGPRRANQLDSASCAYGPPTANSLIIHATSTRISVLSNTLGF